MNVPAQGTEAWLAEFERAQPGLPGAELPWLAQARRSAIAQFAALGLPTTRNESWKYTTLGALEKRAWHTPEGDAPAPDLSALPFVALGGPVLAFVDGRYSPALSSPPTEDGLEILPLARTLAVDDAAVRDFWADIGEADALDALNRALVTDGALLRLAPGARPEQPLLVLSIASGVEGAMAQLRLRLELGAGSSLTLVESYAALGDAPHYTQVESDVRLAAGASLSRVKVQMEGGRGLHIHRLRVSQRADSRLDSHCMALGASLARSEIHVDLAERGASCTLNGLAVGGQRQHRDADTTVHHTAPGCTSRQLYKSVLDGHSRAIYSGRVVVNEGAMGTDATQQCRNLLLSPDAEADARPQLEIWADDVKCAHGATVGQLDEDQLFYLRARGMDTQTARGLLTFAFAEDVVRQVPVAQVRAGVEDHVIARLAAGQAIREFE